MFEEANFLPGEAVSRWVEVTNNSGEEQKIGTEAINVDDPNNLGAVLEIVISEDGTDIYGGSTGTKYLSDFFGAGEIYLSDLSNGATTKYYYSVTFVPEAGNNYQGLSATFDFEIGFFGPETISEQRPFAPGGGGGGQYPTDLIIYNETASGIGTATVTINWQTNLFATSRIIYDIISHSALGNPPNYGYAYSTSEDPTIVTYHTVKIEGLTPGVTYYYRCVSHTSPEEEISEEHSFATLGAAEGEEEEEEEEPPALGEEEEEEEEEIVYLGEEEEEGPAPGEEEEEEEEIVEAEPEGGLERFLAAIGGFNLENICWLFLIFIVILIILSLLSVTKKKPKTKREWILPLVTLISVILYCVFCRSNCWLLILILLILILVLLFLSFRKKLGKKEEQS